MGRQAVHHLPKGGGEAGGDAAIPAPAIPASGSASDVDTHHWTSGRIGKKNSEREENNIDWRDRKSVV